MLCVCASTGVFFNSINPGVWILVIFLGVGDGGEGLEDSELSFGFSGLFFGVLFLLKKLDPKSS